MDGVYLVLLESMVWKRFFSFFLLRMLFVKKSWNFFNDNFSLFVKKGGRREGSWCLRDRMFLNLNSF